MTKQVTAYLGLGSNLGNRQQYMEQAIEALNQHEQIRVTQQADFMETAPVGYVDQPDFLNTVIEIETRLEPLELLAVCQAVEERFGRQRPDPIRFGPRTLDVDILLYGEQHIDLPELQIPHPRMHHRDFVMTPLEQLRLSLRR